MNLRDLFDSIDRRSVAEWTASHREEDLHLEFKVSNSSGLNRDDRKNLAIAISGFANAEGGIIAWGIATEPDGNGNDFAKSVQPIEDVSSFIRALNGHTATATSPPVDGVIHRAIDLDGGGGIALTFVPETEGGPHMAGLGESRYMVRSGSSFVKMEHFQVADMFGRRPRPDLLLKARMVRGSQKEGARPSQRIIVSFSIENSGRGSAVAPALRLFVNSPRPWGVQIPEAARPAYANGGHFFQAVIPETESTRRGHLVASTAVFVIHPGSAYPFLEIVLVCEGAARFQKDEELSFDASLSCVDLAERQVSCEFSAEQLNRVWFGDMGGAK